MQMRDEWDQHVVPWPYEKVMLKCDMFIWVLSYVLSYVTFHGCAI